MSDAFYEPLGDGRYRAGEHTVGPWDPDSQHGGPPSALLARAIEQEPGAGPATIVRVCLDILGPIPVTEVVVRTRVLRPGRRIELVEAEMTAAGRPALRAQAWRVRRADVDLPPAVAGPDDTVPPFPPTAKDFADWSGGYLRAIEWRWAQEPRPEIGAGTVWGRMRFPLVPDEEPTGLQRVLAVADSGSGVSHRLDPREWLFVNTELTLHLAAVPRGQWICLDARTRLDELGFGLATSRLFDRDRVVGQGAQSLFVARR
jgi:hypothetical protein